MTIQMASDTERICRAQHHKGFTCTRAWHRGDHAAHNPQGEILLKWRGGRAGRHDD